MYAVRQPSRNILLVHLKAVSMSCFEGHHYENGEAMPPVDSNKITLFNMRFCPYAERTALVLLAKGLPFDNININLKKKPDWFLNGTLGKVPVILYNDKKVPESLITSDYLEEAYPDPPLSSNDPLQKALDRVIVERVSGMAGQLYRVYVRIPGSPALSNDEKVGLFNKALKECIEPFEKELTNRGTPFLFGERAGMSDYMVWPFFERLLMLPYLVPELKDKLVLPGTLTQVNKWIQAMWETESVKKYAYPPERMARLHKIYMENFEYDRAIAESA